MPGQTDRASEPNYQSVVLWREMFRLEALIDYHFSDLHLT